ncbi:hypothetical protein HFO63_31150 [Rhizobium laguerreae]|jgi:2-oxo-4-hydroxy-4-carboxy--5-ureidoimidazoline (OHCU) decarboxylase|uniref:2-oxo-4-hydroxy-4-carboxy--5-ureidoimidazoline (OHCU) decarboxylase n=1 Tax=Rhizobium laguerreae TaxID=1076926 RepID=A0AB35FJ31_9HYPH|nr:MULTISPECIES: hypothetical protein [Rhizobium]MBB3166039.1 2-oxo-4-hydroxy-4-carboxy--5-ureidoimidazoline (OHCU) decarboxylase [Rhizobium laguerreae]MBN9983238.1 hypothetical protein [Rhizobium laguerreae]MBY3066551.1 hypothetical protein [Rhizobium laguerreae]MBY3079902.1 hypothetical protein [Rhizobium laguerreae]MBY3085989.1 hypothetical protein [Rhizobium laguerreae]
MPGTFTTVYIVAFDLDDRDQAIRAFEPRVAANEEAEIEEAEILITRWGRGMAAAE